MQVEVELMSTAEPSAIRQTPGVCGGEACVRNTRIPVWLLVRYRQLGAGTADLLAAYPSLTQTDIEAALEYYEAHRDEIEAAIRAQEE
jgi:uncharacterized protein (DUF433 family)